MRSSCLTLSLDCFLLNPCQLLTSWHATLQKLLGSSYTPPATLPLHYVSLIQLEDHCPVSFPVPLSILSSFSIKFTCEICIFYSFMGRCYFSFSWISFISLAQSMLFYFLQNFFTHIITWSSSLRISLVSD